MSEQLTTNEARQGKSGTGVSKVLLVSMFLAFVAAVGVYAYVVATDRPVPTAERIENSQ